MKSRVDFQEQQQQCMQQQIVKLLAQPTFPTHQHLQEKPTDYDHKRDTPTTPTAMTDSPERAQSKKANNMAPHNLMESLVKQKQTHQTPTRSHSLTAINKTAQRITKHSLSRTTTTSTSYAKETTGGIQK
jgi:predicted flavoprotein YhiN